jgi:hypothetical protein
MSFSWSSVWRLPAALLALGATLGAGWVAWRAIPRAEPARWFMPGLLGHEPGRPPPPPAPAAYLTRALGGVNIVDGGAWAQLNALTPRLAFSHNLSRVFPPEAHAAHPEFLPEIGGRRAVPDPGLGYWNPDLGSPGFADWAAARAAEHFAANPAARSFALGFNDGVLFGESADTLPWVYPPRYFRRQPDYSDLVFGFMNRVAERIAADWPDRHLGALAYLWAENTPSFPVHPQVLPYLTADRSQGYDAAFREEERALQRAWGRAGPRRLGIYDYIYGFGFLVPRYHPTLLAEHLRHARAAGFTDYYAEMSPNWGLDGPQPWLVAQLLQDPGQDASALLNEYFRRYFRAAGPAMRRFFDRCERVWLEQPGPPYWLKYYRDETQLALYPAPVRAELREELDAAATAAARGRDRLAAARVAWVADTWELSERLTHLHEVRTALVEAVLRRAAPEIVAQGAADFTRARAEAEAHDAWLRRERPGAVGPRYHLQDLLRHDPRPLADTYLAEIGGTAPPLGAERLQSAGWTGERQPVLRIAGLPYAPALPPGWAGSTLPWENWAQTWTETAAGPVLRLEHQKQTSLYQWVQVKAGERLRVRLEARGFISPTARLDLRLTWLTEGNPGTETTTSLRLPPGDWPDWVALAGDWVVPPDIVWLRVQAGVANQQDGDWVELRGISVRER